jgi:hypothetical protein
MKKLLALVLALVMTLGLATVSSNAAYTDAEKIDHTEAVEVLTALKVINGMGDGSFQPEGNVTRAQMAKMIAIILLGADTQDSAFTGTSSELKDINGHWAEGYIKFCVAQKIVAGYGDGTFQPDKNVTTVEASKMLLTALGYNADVQEYKGDNWSINVTRDAAYKKLLEDLDGMQANKAITREEAAQMIWNTLQRGIILKEAGQERDSNGKITDHYTDTDKRAEDEGGKITLLWETFEGRIFVGRFFGNKASGNATCADGEVFVNGRLDSAENKAANYKDAHFPADITIDKLGEEYKVVFKDNKSGTKYQPDKYDTIYGVFNTGMTKVVTAVCDQIKDNKTADATINVNGEVYSTEDVVRINYNYNDTQMKTLYAAQVDGAYTAKNAKGDSSNNSDLTKALKLPNADTVKFVFDEDDKIDLVYVVNYAQTYVASVSGNKVSLNGIGAIDKTKNNNSIYDGVAVGDVVNYTKLYEADKDDATFTVTKAESVEGKITGYKTQSGTYRNVVLDGTEYNFHNWPANLVAVTSDEGDCYVNNELDNDAIGESARVYLINGRAWGVERLSETKYYAVVVDSNGADANASLDGTLNPWKVHVMKADGTKETLVVHKDSKQTGDTALTAADIVEGSLIKYTMSGEKIKIVDALKPTAGTTHGTSMCYVPAADDTEIWNSDSRKLATADDASTTASAAAGAPLFVYAGGATDTWNVYDLRSVKTIEAQDEDKVTFYTDDKGLVVAAFWLSDDGTKASGSGGNTLYAVVSKYVGTREVDDTKYQTFEVQYGDSQTKTIYVEADAKADVKFGAGSVIYFDETAKDLYQRTDIAVVANEVDTDALDPTMGIYGMYANGTAAVTGKTFYGGAVESYKEATRLITFWKQTERADVNGAYQGTVGQFESYTLSKDCKVVYVNLDDDELGDNVGVNKFGVDGYANVALVVDDTDGTVDVIFVESSGASNDFGYAAGVKKCATTEQWTLATTAATKQTTTQVTVGATPNAASVDKGSTAVYTIAVSADDGSAVTNDKKITVTLGPNFTEGALETTTSTNCTAAYDAATGVLTITVTNDTTDTSGTFKITGKPTANISVPTITEIAP